MEKKIHALCHDGRNMIAGSLVSIDERGCEFQSGEAGTMPEFPSRARVMLDLYDELSDQHASVPAKLAGVSRKNGGWSYEIRWSARPPIL